MEDPRPFWRSIVFKHLNILSCVFVDKLEIICPSLLSKDSVFHAFPAGILVFYFSFHILSQLCLIFGL